MSEEVENERERTPGTYATMCIDYRGNEVVEMLSSLATLQRVDPGATVHILANAECKAMLQRAPFAFASHDVGCGGGGGRERRELTLVFDLSIDEYLRLTDSEMNERGLVVEYYSQLFSFLRRILDGQPSAAGSSGHGDRGLLYFMAGCWFLRPMRVEAMPEHAGHSFVGVSESKGAALGDLFFVRDAAFVEEWQARVMDLANTRYEADIEKVIEAKREEYVQMKRAERKRERDMEKQKRKEQAEQEQAEQEQEQPEQEQEQEQPEQEQVEQDESPEQEPIEIPDDFDKQMRKAYRVYVTVNTIKRKFAQVEQVGDHSAGYLADAAYINPSLFFRASDELEFDKLEQVEGVATYKGEPISVMRKLPAQKGGEHLNGPIHKIVTLFANAHPSNQHLLTLASGQKLVFQRAYDADFCGYRHEPHFQSELFEMMEAKNAAYVRSQYLLYPCDSVGGQVQVYPGDDDASLLLPYLSGRVHTLLHFEPSAETKAAFAKYNPGGWSKHLKCAERPLLLHRALMVEQEQAEQTEQEQTKSEEQLEQAEQLEQEQTKWDQEKEEKEQEEQVEKTWRPMTRAELLGREREQALYDPAHDGRKLTRPRPTKAERSEQSDQQPEQPDDDDDGEAAYKEHVARLLGSRFAVVRPDPDAPGVCHQLAEAMACGAVPVVDDGPGALPLDVAGFEHALTPGVHYVDGIEELIRLGLGAEAAMREACVDYYAAHCSPEGFFRTLMSKYW